MKSDGKSDTFLVSCEVVQLAFPFALRKKYALFPIFLPCPFVIVTSSVGCTVFRYILEQTILLSCPTLIVSVMTLSYSSVLTPSSVKVMDISVAYVGKIKLYKHNTTNIAARTFLKLFIKNERRSSLERLPKIFTAFSQLLKYKEPHFHFGQEFE